MTLMTGEVVVWSPAADVRPADPAERLAALFDVHHRRLYGLARRMSGSADAARDLVQETYLRAAQAVASIPDDPAREQAWLVRVMVNVCRDGWRRGAVRRRLDPVHASETLPRAASDQETVLVARTTVWRALGRLAPRRRAIVILYELEGTAIGDIAAMLRVSPVTVRWHLSLGRRELARAVMADG